MPDEELPVEASEADALEQRRDVADGGDAAQGRDPDSFEVPEADAFEQEQTVGGPDDDER